MVKDYRDLKYFFQPNGIAVIGASSDPGKGGAAIYNNLLKWFGGSVYPINPRAATIFGHQAYRSVLDVPGPVDMAVIYIAAPFVPAAVSECAQKGVKAVIIESAGFSEAGPEGQQISDAVLEIAEKAGMRIWGPNCAGFMDTTSGVVTLFGAVDNIRRGGASFFGQSGLLSGSLIDESLAADLFGICKSCSIGNKADLNETDFVEYLGEDPETKVISMYLESIVDGQRFLQAARRISCKKPLLLLKSGRTQKGARAALSHTGSLALDDRVAEGAFKQAGIVRVGDVMDLLDMTRAFSLRPLESAGGRVAIVTASGAGGVMACDELVRRELVVPNLAESSEARLREVFPPWAEAANPIDFWAAVGNVGMDSAFYHSMEVALNDENVDMVLVLMYMMPVVELVDYAKLEGLLKRYSKPVVSWGVGSPEYESIWKKGMENAGVPHFQRISTAAETLAAMRDYVQWREKTCSQIPYKITPAGEQLDRVQTILTHVKDERRMLLNEVESKQVLNVYGIPVTRELIAGDEHQAVDAADSIGYPVVLKILSSETTHKSDIGGVKTNLRDEGQVRLAYRSMVENGKCKLADIRYEGILVQEMLQGGIEVIVGMTRDPIFGPVVMFGLGGVFVEVMKDVVFRAAPLSEPDAEDMVRQIKGYHVLKGVRGGQPSDIRAIVQVLLAVSQLALDVPQIAQIDINPLFVFPQGRGVKALDAVISLNTEKS